jgi:hypothetical protein
MAACHTGAVTQPAAEDPSGGLAREQAHAVPGTRTAWVAAPTALRREELRTAAIVVGALALAGVVAGLVWQWWSPPGPRAFVVGPGMLQPDETEAFVAGDGRFLVVTAAAGVLAAVLLWSRRQVRGTVTVLALAAGGVVGAVLTDLVGYWTAGGTDTGATGTVLAALPLTVHMHGLLLVEAAVAVLLYCLLACFASDDDLGRPDAPRVFARRSVRPDVELQNAGGDRDRAGGA